MSAVKGFALKDLITPERPHFFTWLMATGVLQADAFARQGPGGVLIDMQHGVIGRNAMADMVRVITNGGKPAIVRVPENGWAMASLALDAGAAAIICPMINSAEDARKLVAATRYPPAGARSWGPGVAMGLYGLNADDYFNTANDWTAVFAMIETAQGLAAIDEICAVDGIDGIFTGPSDLSISLAGGKAPDPESDDVMRALPGIVASAKKAGVIPGIFCMSAGQAVERAKMGFQFISCGVDMAILGEGIAAVTGKVGAA